MASANLTPLTSVVSATGWATATPTTLNTSDDSRATGGTVGEQIIAELTDAPADYGSGNSVVFGVEWDISATATRAKSLLLELTNAAGTVVYASYTTPTRTATGESTDTSAAVSLSGSPTKADLDNARLRITAQEGGGMADAAQISIDRVTLALDYNVAAINLVVADSLHGHTADSPTLTAQGPSVNLTVQDSAHGHAAEEPALVQANTLVVQDSAHGHAAEEPALVQANTLVVQDSAHGHTAESPTIQVLIISFIQTASSTVANALNTTINITPTAGNTLFVGVAAGGATTVITVSDNQGNTWSRDVARNFLAGVYGIEFWRADNVVGAATIVTVARNTSGSISAILSEFSGIADSPFDKHSVAASTSNPTTTPSSGLTPTTTQADELVIGFGVISVTGGVPNVTQAANFTSIDAETGLNDIIFAAYRIVNATGQYEFNPTLDVAKGYNLLVVTFKATGVGATLSVADATHGHSAESVTLTQQNVLAVLDAFHGHVAENVNLTQQNIIAVLDAFHGHVADNVVLAQQNILAVFDALHGHIADSVVIAQQNILAVFDALHGHLVDSPTLNLQLNLNVFDALHGQLADNVELTQANVLFILDALHDHSVDNVDLFQQNVLAVFDALHVLLSDQVSLVQQNLLVVHDTAHVLSFENVELVVQGFLGAHDSLHGHLADSVALTQQQILAVQDATHFLLGEAPVLTVAFVLGAQDAHHGLFSEFPTLTQQQILSVQDALHLHTADNTSAIVAYLLVPHDALHVLSSEEPTPTVGFVLIPHDGYHFHFSDMVIIGTLVAVPIRVGNVRAGPLVLGDVRTGAIIRGQGRVGPNIDLGVRS